MERDILEVLQRKDINDTAKLTYEAVRYYDRGNGCWAGREKIGEVVGLSARQVGRGLRALVDAEVLSCERRGLGLTNLYKSLVRVEPEPVHPDVPKSAPHELQLEKEQKTEPVHVSYALPESERTYIETTEENEENEEEPEHVETFTPESIPPKPKRLPTWIVDGEEFSWNLTDEQIRDLRAVKAHFEDLFDEPVSLKECAYWMFAYPAGRYEWRTDQILHAVFRAYEAHPNNPIAYLNAGTQGTIASSVPFLIPNPFSEPSETSKVYQDPPTDDSEDLPDPDETPTPAHYGQTDEPNRFDTLWQELPTELQDDIRRRCWDRIRSSPRWERQIQYDYALHGQIGREVCEAMIWERNQILLAMDW